MSRPSPVQWVLGGVGVATGVYGAWLLLSRQDLDQLLSAAVWLAVGVIAHDVVLAPLLVLAGLGVSRAVPRWARAAVVVGAVVLGSVTLLAVPVLGRFGALDDNPTLLDRPYGAGWLVLSALTAVGVLAGSLLVRHRRGHDADTQARVH